MPFPILEDLLDPGSKTTSPVAPALQAEFFIAEPPGKADSRICMYTYICSVGCYLIAKSCPTLATPWTIAPSLFCPWDFPGKNTGVSCCFLLWWVILTQELNPYLLHCSWITYHWATREATYTYGCVCVCIFFISITDYYKILCYVLCT